jgi:hypothetical protein
MPSRSNNSRISALLSGKSKRRRPEYTLEVCPSCGEHLAAADHAVFLGGRAYHAGCVLYQRRVRAGTG